VTAKKGKYGKKAFCRPDEVMNVFVDIDIGSLKLSKEEYVALNVYDRRSRDFA
jgi:hypothetical protein